MEFDPRDAPLPIRFVETLADVQEALFLAADPDDDDVPLPHFFDPRDDVAKQAVCRVSHSPPPVTASYDAMCRVDMKAGPTAHDDDAHAEPARVVPTPVVPTPVVSKVWTVVEDNLVHTGVQRFGYKWTAIRQHMGLQKHTADSIRGRYFTLTGMRKSQTSSSAGRKP